MIESNTLLSLDGPQESARQVTSRDMERRIASVHYFDGFDGVAGRAYNEACPEGVLVPFRFTAPGRLCRVIFCIIVLKNGTMVTGEFQAQQSQEFDQKKSEQAAYRQAFQKIRPLLEYAQSGALLAHHKEEA